MTKQSIFEKTECSRCGGSGKYSSHALYGRTCFKCHGAKTVLTKRGLAARSYFKECLATKVTDLEVGNHIWRDGDWRKILEIKPSTCNHKSCINGEWHDVPMIEIVTSKITYHVYTDSLEQKHPQDSEGNSCEEAMREFKKHVVEYQSKLTKTGKVANKYQEAS